MNGILEGTYYLIVSKAKKSYGTLSFRITSKEPMLAKGEISIRVDVALPTTLFERPILNASIKVPTDKVSPQTISAEVADNIADTLKQNLGLDMTIKVGEPS